MSAHSKVVQLPVPTKPRTKPGNIIRLPTFLKAVEAFNQTRYRIQTGWDGEDGSNFMTPRRTPQYE